MDKRNGSRSRKVIIAVGIGGVLAGAVAAFLLTRKPPSEAPPPLDPVTPPTSSSVVLELPPPEVDAGDAGDEGDAKRPSGGPVDVTGLRACCAALAQNAASMPPPNNAYAAAAASYCNASVTSVNQPGQRDAVFAQVRTLMKGSPMPTSCR